MRLYGKTFLLHALSSIISLLFFFLFLLLVSFVCSPLIVLEFFIILSHLVCGGQNIQKSIKISTLLVNFMLSSLTPGTEHAKI